RDAYEPATWKRLTELKAAYDPDNVLRPSLAIPPAEKPAPAERS
ncbi:MAG: BBE domain-containing protein, partial [Mycobacterium sp.]|nr:BBE domain-containing protein [Mycobacterium sp.]